MTKNKTNNVGIRFNTTVYNINDIIFIYHTNETLYINFYSDKRNTEYIKISMSKENFILKEKEFLIKKYGEIL